MSDTSFSAPWWSEYQLAHRPFACSHDLDRAQAVPWHNPRIALLSRAKPVLFEVDGEQLSAGELRSRMADAWAEFQAPIEADADTRSRLGWAALEAAPLAPDADEVIADGGWAGFARARARQWCWNLFQYEPRGYSLPISTMSLPGVKEWLGGGVPDVRGYADRARALEADGVTPHAYRQEKEAAGKVTFTRRDALSVVVPGELAGRPDAVAEYVRAVAVEWLEGEEEG